MAGTASRLSRCADRSALEILISPRPTLSAPRDRYVYFPNHAEVPEAQAVVVRGRSFVIGALVDLPEPGAEGVIFAQGSRFGGHSLYVKDNRLHYVNSFVGLFDQKVVATVDLPTGEGLAIGRDVGDRVTDDYPGVHPYRFTGGTIRRVAVDVSGEPYIDLQREAQGMLMRE